MNTNELADELVWIAKNRGDSISRQLADIVSQQQSEIAELKHINKNWQISENILLLELEKLQHCELTDEEIMELSYMTSDNDPIAFVRAILRKAQEG